MVVAHAARDRSAVEPEHERSFGVEEHQIHGGPVGPSTGIASDMAFGAPAPGERALQFAAKTYLGDVHDWTDLLLLAGGGALASLRIVRAAGHVPAAIQEFKNPIIVNNYMDLLETYKRSLAELSQLHQAGHIRHATLQDFTRYLKEAFRQAFHNSVVTGVQADEAFRHAVSLKVPPDVAKQLTNLVKAVCNKGNWQGKPKK